ncbi:tetraspanin-13-like [Tropilaelaps mercedesae]|uniref:Tetraspanin-13-like n=1 Tax=Tropilaelaps mercedesae TaxID=418985 RepID=A0A1V9X312_9ACAR|nr:tetraspanin-13-like [Tropilaelaps mercedesae]
MKAGNTHRWNCETRQRSDFAAAVLARIQQKRKPVASPMSFAALDLERTAGRKKPIVTVFSVSAPYSKPLRQGIYNSITLSHNSCVYVSKCPPCWSALQERFEHGLSMVATIGAMCSFCLLLGVWTTFCYRNTKDPAKIMSPNAFL